MTHRELCALHARVRGAAAAFLEPIENDFWAEHGIDESEAHAGTLAMMVHLGLVSPGDAEQLRERWQEHRHKCHVYARWQNERRYARLTPEQRAHEKQMANMMRASARVMETAILDTIFASPSVLSSIRDPK